MSAIGTASGALTNTDAERTAAALGSHYLRNYPRQAARRLESMTPADAVNILSAQPPEIGMPVWSQMTPSAASLMLPYFTDDLVIEMLVALDAGPCANLLGRMEAAHRERYLGMMNEAMAKELRVLLEYPQDSAGHIMDTRVLGFDADISVGEAMKQLRRHPAPMRRRIFILDAEDRLRGQVELAHLVAVDPELTLDEVSDGIRFYVQALDPRQDVAEMLQKNSIEALPVVDVNHRLLGVIRGLNAIETLKQDFAVDMQTMVGASRDEQALSSAFFAVRKRQGWLQINLLTSFLAAAVVGLFESTIAQFTALAVLMPIAAGQSGNTGAQALAVTMRGLTLREITTRHWFRVMFKEAGAGLINGLAIALTCGLGVYAWSQSFGLALVIALAMVISMTIAGIGGALVPICLQRLGQDPAQSSSIIMTTITDIAGFMSFLGIATMLSSLLAQT